MRTFDSLGLPELLHRGIREAGYTTPTPIQAQAIPSVLEGHDLIGCAQTGTGKTAAFVLPMLARLIDSPARHRHVRALVVTPTRELARQVENAVRTYGKHTSFRSLCVYGGTGMQSQARTLRRGVSIVVATPGRLLDHVRRGNLDLSHLEILVLDEADRMMDMGFLPDIRKIVQATPRERQTLLFSATMPEAIQQLSASIMREPLFIEVGERRKPAETVNQQVFMAPHERKLDLLIHILKTEDTDGVLVFSRTKARADRIYRKLTKMGFKATVLHSDRTQGQRQKALQEFKQGRMKVLVATDIAARGLDVEHISHVINFDTPEQPESYIHRIGRTGRAQAAGEAITFVANDEFRYLKNIERHIGKRFLRRMVRPEVEHYGNTINPPRRSAHRR